jgi:hypothetical protein
MLVVLLGLMIKNITAFRDVQWRIANSSAMNGVFLHIGARLTL